MVNLAKLTAAVESHEGLVLHVYDDANGKPVVPGYTLIGHPTIGYGRALDTYGVTADEAKVLLMNNINVVVGQVSAMLPWSATLDDVRLRVLLEMAFNLGIAGLMEFHDTLRHIQAGQYNLASVSMMDSLWAKQVGSRADVLSKMMASGLDSA